MEFFKKISCTKVVLLPFRYTSEGSFLFTVRNWKTHLFTLTLLTWSPQLELRRLSLRLA
jgi:hypothetical protein